MPKIRKRSSKRLGLREKYAVKKKVAAHHKKIKKVARKLTNQGLAIPVKIQKGKRNTVPNSFPGKEQLINEMETEFEQQKEYEKQQLKEQRLLASLPQKTQKTYEFSEEIK